MEGQLPTTGHAAGHEYLSTYSVDQRRASGRIYTPPHLVEFVLEQAGYLVRHPADQRPLLDPACGAGVFLEQAIAVLLNRLRRNGVDPHGAAGFRHFLELIECQLWGVDSDERSCEIARAVVRGTVEYLTGQKAPRGFFDSNIVNADFLSDPVVEALPPIRDKYLGFLVGNPPYVSTTRLDAAYKQRLRARYISASGRIDLYTLFVERALAVLPKGGRLTLITPDKFLTSYSARALRSHVLRESAIRSIALFDSHKVFQNAAIVPCITVFEKGARKAQVWVRKCVSDSQRALVRVIERRKMTHFDNGTAEWRVLSDDVKRLVARLQAGHPTLADTAQRISAGPATGRDAIFVSPTADARDVEPELLRPVVRGRDITRYRIADANLSILLPYVFDKFGNTSIVDLRKYPGAARRLAAHRETLIERHCVRIWGKAWYEFHDQPAVDLARCPKIVVPDVADSNRFAVDSGRFFPLHSAYYILPKASIDLDYLTAVLNSDVAAFLVRVNSPLVKDGFQRYRQQFLASLPVPNASATEVSLIAKASDAGDHERANALVEKLFRLASADAAKLRAYLLKRAS